MTSSEENDKKERDAKNITVRLMLKLKRSSELVTFNQSLTWKCKFMANYNLISVGVMLLVISLSSAVAANPGEQLQGMAKKLAEAKQFSVSINMSYDVVQESGQKIQFSEVRKVLISRPNYMRVDTQQSDGDTGGLIFNGKTLTLFNTTENVYSQTQQSGDVDAAVRYAVGKLGIRVPLARMLTTTLPQELQKLITRVDFVERNTLGTMPTDHIAAQSRDVDFQVWIGKDMLPTRMVLTYKKAPGQPQFQAVFSSWNLSPVINDASFTFTPAKGAEKIPTLLPAKRQDSINKAQGDAS